MTTSYTVFQAQSVQASPGLNVPTPGQSLPGIPPNMSVLAAMSAGLLPAGAMQTSMGTADSRPGRTVLESQGIGQAKGAGQSTTNPYMFPNGGTAGGAGPGAGGENQTQGPTSGETSILVGAAQGTQAATCIGLQPAAAISSPNLSIPAQPVFQG
jgi:hypothetical protein